MTREAAWPVVKPAPLTYSRTRLLASSATQRLPEESKAIPVGKQRLLALAPPRSQFPVLRLAWPRTSEAASPVVNGGVYSRIRLLSESATQRLPEESKASPVGMVSPAGEAAFMSVVKDDWPRTRVLDWVFVKA